MLRIKMLVIVVLVGLSVGCAQISWEKDKFKYSRFGRQSIDGLVVEKNKDGTLKVKIGKQTGDSGSLVKALSDIAKVSAGAAGMKLVSP
jgi:hypothetical protein